MAAILNAPPAYFAQTPGYGSQSAPMYSDTPGASERILASALSSPVTGTLSRTDTNRSLETDFVYKTDHMEVNLGSRLWGLRTPTYGSQGHVEGFVKLLEEQAHVTCVRARVGSAFSHLIKYFVLIAPSSCAGALLSRAVILAKWRANRRFVFFNCQARYIRLVVGRSLRHHGAENIDSLSLFHHT
jgi:hypothetical protein